MRSRLLHLGIVDLGSVHELLLGGLTRRSCSWSRRVGEHLLGREFLFKNLNPGLEGLELLLGVVVGLHELEAGVDGGELRLGDGRTLKVGCGEIGFQLQKALFNAGFLGR